MQMAAISSPITQVASIPGKRSSSWCVKALSPLVPRHNIPALAVHSLQAAGYVPVLQGNFARCTSYATRNNMDISKAYENRLTTTFMDCKEFRQIYAVCLYPT